MKRVDDKRWSWPNNEDILRYEIESDFLSFIPEVIPVTKNAKNSRYMMIPTSTWTYLVKNYQDKVYM